MATQAKVYGPFPESVGRAESAAESRRMAGDIYRLRKLANEDVYFFRKAIDNSRIVRQADPRGWGRCWRLMATTAAAMLVILGLFWPNIDGMLAGYELESLKQQQQRMTAERTALELEEARMLSPERLEELARIQEFIDPAPAQVVYLNPKADGSLALNVNSSK